MDAEDIFKKLSRGARFAKRRPNGQVKPNISSIKIKTEQPDSEDEDSTPVSAEKSDNTLTLLGDITTTEHTKKGKKRKATDNIETEQKKQKLLAEEQVNQCRNQNHISVVGRHIAAPAKSFDELPIPEDLKSNLLKCGYTDPTAIQKQAIPIMVDNRQILACAPTGSGKTAAFLIPIINSLATPQKSGCRALVICPTRELATQTQKECLRLAEGRNLKIHVITKVKQASNKHDILITTPNRLCFLLKQDSQVVTLGNVEWVVIDEADKLFEEGTRGFKDQLTEVLTACTGSNRKIAMFSATYTPAVAKWCLHNMRGLIRLTVGQRNATTDLVEQELMFVGNEEGKLIAFRDLIRKGLTPPVLVFVQSKERAQQLFSELIYDGVNVDAIHADRTQLQRDNTVRSFREGHIWVLICTELMARGVDFKGVNLVINYDFPPSAIAYVHRVGRAGRAGRKGKAITFFTLEDTVNLRSIAHVLKQSGCEVPNYMLYMKKQSKKLKNSAPQRDDILTVPYDERRRIDKALGKNRLHVNKKKPDGKNKKFEKPDGKHKKFHKADGKNTMSEKANEKTKKSRKDQVKTKTVKKAGEKKKPQKSKLKKIVHSKKTLGLTNKKAGKVKASKVVKKG